MDDFVFNLIWTLCVAIFTFLSELIATKFIVLKSAFSNIGKVIKSNQNPSEKIDKVKEYISELESSASPIWGAELSAVALSVDFAALGIWITSPDIFPFFNEVAGGNHEIPTWLILFLIHFLILLFAIICRQLYAETVKLFSTTYNRWLFIGNATGFCTLFSTFTILTNSI